MEIDLGEIRKDVQCPICLGTSTPMLLLSFSFDFAENMFFKFLVQCMHMLIRVSCFLPRNYKENKDCDGVPAPLLSGMY